MNKHISIDSSKIVLGHPLSGAIYAYFDKELNEGNAIKSKNSYYKTLYGKHFESYIDIALTLALIYDNVILSAADNIVPDSQKYQSDGEYYNTDFGLYLAWGNEVIHYDFLTEKVREILEDLQIKNLLNGIPVVAHWQIIREIYLDLEMANKFNAPLFTLGRRQALAQRIIEIERFGETEMSGTKQTRIISNYLDITGLLFQPVDIKSFYYLKSEKDLRDYSKSFLNLINNYQYDNSIDLRNQLLLAIKEAISKDSLNSKTSGVFNVSSTVMNYISLVPLAGTAAGLIGIGAELAATGIDRLNEKNKWYEFASQIEKTKSMEKIHNALKDIK